MRYSLIVALAAFGLTLVPAHVRADLAPPVPAPKDVKFTIEVDEKAKGPKLILPVGFTKAQFRPRGPVPKANQAKDKEPVAYVEVEGDDEATPTPRNPKHLMIAGIGMTLALGFGGIWLVRRPGRGATRGLILLLVAGATLTASTVVWANAPPPPPPKKEKVVLPIAFEGNVNLEVTIGGDSIRLILDKETLEKIKKDSK
jgi:hypothetical protein